MRWDNGVFWMAQFLGKYTDFHPLPVQELYCMELYENILWSYDILWSLGPWDPTHLQHISKQTEGENPWFSHGFWWILLGLQSHFHRLRCWAAVGGSDGANDWVVCLKMGYIYNPSGHVNMENIGKWWFTSEFRGSLGSRESHILMNQMFVGNVSY